MCCSDRSSFGYSGGSFILPVVLWQTPVHTCAWVFNHFLLSGTTRCSLLFLSSPLLAILGLVLNSFFSWNKINASTARAPNKPSPLPWETQGLPTSLPGWAGMFSVSHLSTPLHRHHPAHLRVSQGHEGIGPEPCRGPEPEASLTQHSGLDVEEMFP